MTNWTDGSTRARLSDYVQPQVVFLSDDGETRTSTMARYVLYINQDYTGKGAYCPGSSRCLEILSDLPDVEVQHIDDILKSGVNLPQWLEGTPCLVDTQTATATKGSNAIELARRIEDESRIREVEAAADAPGSEAEGDESADDNVFASPAANVDTEKIESKRVDDMAVQEFMAKRSATEPETDDAGAAAVTQRTSRPKRKATRSGRAQQEQALSPPKSDSVKPKKSG